MIPEQRTTVSALVSSLVSFPGYGYSLSPSSPSILTPDYDALACDYTGQDEWRTQMDEDGKMNIYVDLAEGAPRPPSPVHETDIDPMCQDCPPMNIVIYIVGSRGGFTRGSQLTQQAMYSRI